MRYVHGKLVLRLHRLPDEALLRTIHAEFSDILATGGFQPSGPLPEEKDETALAGLPRLVLQFNRHSYGRLRQLIDRLNAGT
jgi:hypothetical protein